MSKLKADTPDGIWLSPENVAKLLRVVEYLYETEERHYEETPEDERDTHIFEDVRGLDDLLQAEEQLLDSLKHGRANPGLYLNEVERVDDDSMHIGVNDLFDVRLVKTDEGLVVDVYPAHSTDAEPCGSTYAFDDEVRRDEQ